MAGGGGGDRKRQQSESRGAEGVAEKQNRQHPKLESCHDLCFTHNRPDITALVDWA